MNRSIILFAVAVIVAACSRKSDAAGDSGAASAAGPVIPKPNAATITPKQFADLKWIEGYWRGAAPDGPPFYERYVFTDDSSIAMYVYPDSTYTAANDSAHIILRNGVLRDSGRAASWVASRVDSAGLDFEPEWGATNTFTWQRDGDSWTATIQSGSGAGKSVAVYRMRRVNR